MRASTPLKVPNLDGVDVVEESNGFIHALKSNGTVWGWGINNQGQLGDGTTTDRFRPVQTVGLTNVKALSAGDFFAAALKTDGTVWIWGVTSLLTSNTNFSFDTTPVQLTGINNVSAIAAGGNHLLMLKTDKTLWAIGSNSMGELGDGTSTRRTTPVQVVGLSNVSHISPGSELSIARKEDGTIWAWGGNFNGQLGPNGGAMDFAAHPNAIQVTGLPQIIEISAGRDFCLAVASDGTVWGWGNNGFFQLGSGSSVSQNPTPKQIPNFTNVAKVAGGNNHSVALKTDGTVWTWGSNADGQLGDPSALGQMTPVRVSGLQTVGGPLFNPPGGNFLGSVDVTVTCPLPGAIVHYTTNGFEPTEADPVVPCGGSVRLTTTTFLQARAWAPGMVPSGSVFLFFNVQPLPPKLMLDETGPAPDQLAALDSVMLLRDPFPVINAANILKKPSDPNTRVILFVLDLPPGASQPNGVSISLNDASGNFHNVIAEDVRTIPGVDFKQVIFRLPNNLAVGNCQVRLFSQNVMSNLGTIRIKP